MPLPPIDPIDMADDSSEPVKTTLPPIDTADLVQPTSTKPAIPIDPADIIGEPAIDPQPFKPVVAETSKMDKPPSTADSVVKRSEAVPTKAPIVLPTDPRAVAAMERARAARGGRAMADIEAETVNRALMGLPPANEAPEDARRRKLLTLEEARKRGDVNAARSVISDLQKTDPDTYRTIVETGKQDKFISLAAGSAALGAAAGIVAPAKAAMLAAAGTNVKPVTEDAGQRIAPLVDSIAEIPYSKDLPAPDFLAFEGIPGLDSEDLWNTVRKSWLGYRTSSAVSQAEATQHPEDVAAYMSLRDKRDRVPPSRYELAAQKAQQTGSIAPIAAEFAPGQLMNTLMALNLQSTAMFVPSMIEHAPEAIASGGLGALNANTILTFMASRSMEGAGMMEQVLQQRMQTAGADPNDPEQVLAVLGEPQTREIMHQQANAKGIPIALVDAALTRIMPYATIAETAKRAARVKNTVKMAVAEGVGSGIGEVAGELTAGEDLSPADIAAEMAGGGSKTVYDIVSASITDPRGAKAKMLQDIRATADPEERAKKLDEAGYKNAAARVRFYADAEKTAYEKATAAEAEIIAKGTPPEIAGMFGDAIRAYGTAKDKTSTEKAQAMRQAAEDAYRKWREQETQANQRPDATPPPVPGQPPAPTPPPASAQPVAVPTETQLKTPTIAPNQQDAQTQAPHTETNATEQAGPLPGERTAPVEAKTPDDIRTAEKVIDQNATPAQKEAENYKQAHVRVQGYDLTLETAKGSTRTAADGSWSVPNFPASYGKIKGSKGRDWTSDKPQQLDAYVGDNPASDRVFVIDQKDPKTGEFDEHKVMLGFNSAAEARTAYEKAFSDGSGPSRIQAITQTSKEHLNDFIASGRDSEAVRNTEYATYEIGRNPPAQAPGPTEGVPTTVPAAGTEKPPVQTDVTPRGEELSPPAAQSPTTMKGGTDVGIDTIRQPSVTEAVDQSPPPHQAPIVEGVPTEPKKQEIRNEVPEEDQQAVDRPAQPRLDEEAGAVPREGRQVRQEEVTDWTTASEFFGMSTPAKDRKVLADRGEPSVIDLAEMPDDNLYTYFTNTLRTIRGIQGKGASWQDSAYRLKATAAYNELRKRGVKSLESPPIDAYQKADDKPQSQLTQGDKTNVPRGTTPVWNPDSETLAKAGRNPHQDAVPSLIPAIARPEKSKLMARSPIIINGHKGAGIENSKELAGIYAAGARHASVVADMFAGSAIVDMFLAMNGLLQGKTHIMSEWEPLRAIAWRQIAGENWKQVQTETEQMGREVLTMLKAIRDMANEAKNHKNESFRLINQWKRFILDMGNLSNGKIDDIDWVEELVKPADARRMEYYTKLTKKFIEKNNREPTPAEAAEILVRSMYLQTVRHWSQMKIADRLDPAENLLRYQSELDVFKGKFESLSATAEALSSNSAKSKPTEKMSPDIIAALERSLTRMKQRLPTLRPLRLKDDPTTAAFGIVVQWATGGQLAATTEPERDGSMLATPIDYVNIDEDTSTDKMVKAVELAHESIAGANIYQGDSWRKMVDLSAQHSGIFLVVDPSYFAKAKEDGKSRDINNRKNYGIATDIKRPEDLLYYVDTYLIPAWNNGARISLTNTYDKWLVGELRLRGFNVAEFSRANEEPEFVAYNFNPVSGTVLASNPKYAGAEAPRESPARVKMSPEQATAMRGDSGMDPLTRDIDQAAWAERNPESAAVLRAIVDEAAKDAGFNVGPVYHGTPDSSFTVFKSRAGWGGQLGFWFSENREVAEKGFARPRYAGATPGIKTTVLSVRRPMVYHGWKELVDHVNKLRAGGDISEGNRMLRRSLIRRGYDGIHLVDSNTDVDITRSDWVAFSPQQIKSYDLATFRKDGTPYAIEDRFQTGSKDIRESPSRQGVTPEQDAEYMAAVERGDMETAANKIASVLRDYGLDVSVTTGRRGQGGVGYPSGSYYINLKDISERVSQIRVSDHFAIKRPTQVWDTYTDGYHIEKILRSAMDEVYLDHVYEYEKRGKKERLSKIQRMVDEAAKAEGSIDAEHGTDNSQIKSAYPITRDDQGNVIPLSKRFNQQSQDIRESPAREDQSKTLIAIHNLTPENLLHSAELGGIPVPSVAITKPEVSFTGFGSISLLGSRRLIDPQTSRTKIFDADAWTTRHPDIVWRKVKRAKADELSKRMWTVQDETEDHAFSNEVWDNLIHRPDKNRAIERMLSSEAAKLQFLRENGKNVDVVIRPKPTRYEFTRDRDLVAWVNAQDSLRDARPGDEVWREFSAQVSAAIDRYEAKRGANMDEAIKEYIADLRESLFDADGNLYFGYGDSVLTDVMAVGKKEVDRNSTVKAIEDAVKSEPDGQQKFEEWVRTALDIFDQPQIRVRGRLVPYTLDNIVDAMTTKSVRGKEEGITFGVGKARGASAKQFDSIDGMKREQEKIQDKKSLDKYEEEVEKPALAAFQNAAMSNRRNMEPGQSVGFSSAWEILDDSMKAVAEYLKGGQVKRNADRMRRALSMNYFRASDPAFVELAMDAAHAIVNAPTEYFEAKLLRGVPLSEFSAAIIPNTTTKAVREALAIAGVQTVEYNPKREGSRERAVARTSERLNLRFSSARGVGGQYNEFAEYMDQIGPIFVPYTISKAEGRRGQIKINSKSFPDHKDEYLSIVDFMMTMLADIADEQDPVRKRAMRATWKAWFTNRPSDVLSTKPMIDEVKDGFVSFMDPEGSRVAGDSDYDFMLELERAWKARTAKDTQTEEDLYDKAAEMLAITEMRPGVGEKWRKDPDAKQIGRSADNPYQYQGTRVYKDKSGAWHVQMPNRGWLALVKGREAYNRLSRFYEALENEIYSDNPKNQENVDESQFADQPYVSPISGNDDLNASPERASATLDAERYDAGAEADAGDWTQAEPNADLKADAALKAGRPTTREAITASASIKEVYRRAGIQTDRLESVRPSLPMLENEAWTPAYIMAGLAGHKLVPVRWNLRTNGVVYDDTIYVSDRTDMPVMTTAGHEILHLWEQKYGDTPRGIALRQALDELAPADRLDAYRKELGRNHRLPAGMTTAQRERWLREELYADLLGESVTKQSFWERLAEISTDAFRSLYRMLGRIVSRMMGVDPAYSTDPYFTDLVKARDIAAEIYQMMVQDGTISEATGTERMSPARQTSAVTHEQDAEYMAAVERGDMDAAQMMVDEAAKRYATRPDRLRRPEKIPTDLTSAWAELEAEHAGELFYDKYPWYGKTEQEVRDAAASIKRQYIADYNNADKENSEVADFFGEQASPVTDEKRADLKARMDANIQRADRFIDEWKATKQKFFDDASGKWIRGDLIESLDTDPVTRDDQGTVIPLSKRFNPQSQDIRESPARKDATEGNYLDMVKEAYNAPPPGWRTHRLSMREMNDATIEEWYKEALGYPHHYEKIPDFIQETMTAAKDVMRSYESFPELAADILRDEKWIGPEGQLQRMALALIVHNTYREAAFEARRENRKEDEKFIVEQALQMNQFLNAMNLSMGRTINLNKANRNTYSNPADIDAWYNRTVMNIAETMTTEQERKALDDAMKVGAEAADERDAQIASIVAELTTLQQAYKDQGDKYAALLTRKNLEATNVIRRRQEQKDWQTGEIAQAIIQEGREARKKAREGVIASLDALGASMGLRMSPERTRVDIPPSLPLNVYEALVQAVYDGLAEGEISLIEGASGQDVAFLQKLVGADRYEAMVSGQSYEIITEAKLRFAEAMQRHEAKRRKKRRKGEPDMRAALAFEDSELGQQMKKNEALRNLVGPIQQHLRDDAANPLTPQEQESAVTKIAHDMDEAEIDMNDLLKERGIVTGNFFGPLFTAVGNISDAEANARYERIQKRNEDAYRAWKAEQENIKPADVVLPTDDTKEISIASLLPPELADKMAGLPLFRASRGNKTWTQAEIDAMWSKQVGDAMKPASLDLIRTTMTEQEYQGFIRQKFGDLFADNINAAGEPAPRSTAILGTPVTKLLHPSIIGRTIRQQIRDLQTTAQSILTSHYTTKDRLKANLIAKLREGLNLSPYQAIVLANEVDGIMKGFYARERLKAAKRFKAIFDSTETGGRNKKALNDLLAMINAGIFEDRALIKTWANAVGATKMTDADYDTMLAFAPKIKEAHFDFESSERINELFQFVHSKTPYKAGEILRWFIYTNLLSGYKDDVRNLVYSTVSTLDMMVTLAGKNPKRLAAAMYAAVANRSIHGGLTEAAASMAGKPVAKHIGALDISRDFVPATPGLRQYAKTATLISLRPLGAMDMLITKQSQDVVMHVLATAQMTESGMSERAARRKATELVYGTRAARRQWWKDATEAYPTTGLTGKAKAAQILRQHRAFEESRMRQIDGDLRAKGLEWASIGMSNNVPEGLTGEAYRAVMSLTQSINGKYGPVGKYAAQAHSLFMRIAANIINANLSMFPTWIFGRKPKSFRRDTPAHQKSFYRRREITGMALIALVYALDWWSETPSDDDDEDKKKERKVTPPFACYGFGPNDPTERAAWIQSGGRPFSLRLPIDIPGVGKKGDLLDYRQLAPFSFVLAAAGVMADVRRGWIKVKDPTIVDHITYVATGVIRAITGSTWLTTYAQTFDLIGGNSYAENIGDVVAQAVGNAIHTLTPQSALIKQMNELFTRTVYQDDVMTDGTPTSGWRKFAAYTLRNMPFADHWLKPRINALGDIVDKEKVGIFVNEWAPDPVYNWLMKEDLTHVVMRGPSVSTRIGDKEDGHNDPNTGRLDPNDHYNLTVYSGHAIKAAITAELAKANPAWGTTPEQKEKWLEDTRRNAIEDAKKKIIRGD